MKRPHYFYIPLTTGPREKRGKLRMGRIGPLRVKEVIGMAIVNPRGVAAGKKNVIVGA